MSEGKIQLLDDGTINQIAAGEVIENCASVVKELVENALDAGAQNILVETKHEYVRVVDDGAGIQENDLPMAIMRHATSKLRHIQDLNSLKSLGFRGEALASIASISKLIVLSSNDETGKGNFIEAHGGVLHASGVRPRRRGTTIEVHSLFFNVPARKKFLRSQGREISEIQKTLTNQALCHPAVGFKWIHQNKAHFEVDRECSFFERIEKLIGEEYAASLLPVEEENSIYRLSGLVSNPSYHRPNRGGQFLFVNGRAVVSPFVSAKVLEGYATRLQNGRFPVFVLNLCLPEDRIDVNVHPQKKEIRLREEDKLGPFLVRAVEKSLEKKERPFPFFVSLPPISMSLNDEKEKKEQFFLCDKVHKEENGNVGIQTAWLLKPRFLSKIGNYFLVEKEGKCIVVDTYRARSRLFFEYLSKPDKYKEQEQLLIPLRFEFSEAESIILETHLDAINEMGISLRSFGQKTFIVDALPPLMAPEDCETMLRVFLENGSSSLIKKAATSLHDKALSKEEGMMVIEKIFSCDAPDMAPDGTRIFLELTEEELKRRFT